MSDAQEHTSLCVRRNWLHFLLAKCEPVRCSPLPSVQTFTCFSSLFLLGVDFAILMDEWVCFCFLFSLQRCSMGAGTKRVSRVTGAVQSLWCWKMSLSSGERSRRRCWQVRVCVKVCWCLLKIGESLCESILVSAPDRWELKTLTCDPSVGWHVRT